MTLRPPKHSDRKKLQEKMHQQKKKIEQKHQLPPYILIVSEGIKTEPFYLKGFVKKINERYKSITKEEHIEVIGTGRNTVGLLEYVENNIRGGEWSRFERFWLVYDKDDFPFDNFDNAQFSAENRKEKNKFHVAWSNESIELWFLLHFQDYRSSNGREQYIEKLNNYFDYSKTREDLYNVIMEKGSLDSAKRRAKTMYKEFLKSETSPSAMVPATRMFELIEELEQY